MAKSNLASTQSHLDIEDIKDNLVILKDKNVAMVMESNALNFELLSEEEQEVRILEFSSLLNSLKFNIQIVIRTERARLDDYLNRLNELHNGQTSPALKKQMEIYIKFVQNLTTKTEVLKKRFFIVIKTPFVDVKSTTKSLLPFIGSKEDKDVRVDIEKAKDYLNPKRDFLFKQFSKMSLKLRQLRNNELLQLYYDIYDPDKVGVRRVQIDESDYTTGVVETMSNDLIDEVVGNGINK
jgi:hypothetical protein